MNKSPALGRPLVLFVLIVLAISLGGCAKKECKITDDCKEKTCSTVSCQENKCVYKTQKNCCGNDQKDSLEDGKPGSKCTCPEDYGKCEGRPKIKSGSKFYDAKYLQQYCEADVCVMGVPSELVRSISLLDERDLQYFRLETSAIYNEPFDITKDQFRFKFNVVDESEDMIWPVKITKIVIRDGELIFAERVDSTTLLGGVGDTSNVVIPVTAKLQQVEESRSLTLKVNYEFYHRVKIGRTENGSAKYETILERKDFEKKFSTKVNLVQS